MKVRCGILYHWVYKQNSSWCASLLDRSFNSHSRAGTTTMSVNAERGPNLGLVESVFGRFRALRRELSVTLPKVLFDRVQAFSFC